MREIKFRGLIINTKRWAYGYYCVVEGKSFIIFDDAELYDTPYEEGITDYVKVIPETVGQFTGLFDRHGKEIYEGDIIHLVSTYETDEPVDCNTEVIFDEGVFRTRFHGLLLYGFTRKGNWEGEKIGDIHTTPELLE